MPTLMPDDPAEGARQGAKETSLLFRGQVNLIYHAMVGAAESPTDESVEKVITLANDLAMMALMLKSQMTSTLNIMKGITDAVHADPRDDGPPEAPGIPG